MRRVRKGNVEPDNWRCNAEKWRNSDQDRVVGLPQTSHPAVNIKLFARPHPTSLQRLITTLTRMKQPKSIFSCRPLHRLMPRPSVPLKGKGMQLGKKANTRLYDALSGEIASVEATTPVATTPSTPSTAQETPLSASEGIQIAFSETMSAKTNRDGGLEAMDVQGQLNLQISDSSLSRIQLGLHANESDGTQFKTHPNVDRNLFKDHRKIGLRDASRPFPLNQQMSVLRWRLQAKPNSVKLPISG